MMMPRRIRQCPNQQPSKSAILNRRSPMKKARFFALIVALFAVIPILQAQDTPSNQSVPKKEAPKKVAYRVDFKLYELEDGKRVNQREYSLIAGAANHQGRGSTIRIGTRVPVSYEDKKETYMNVGLDLNCNLWQDDDSKLWGWFDVEISTFALPEQNADPRHGGMPILRTSH